MGAQMRRVVVRQTEVGVSTGAGARLPSQLLQELRISAPK